jgi:hypothetical protein
MSQECFEGKFLKGRQGEGRLRGCALYAFGAGGNPELRPMVEYQLARATDSREKKAAQVALELWGRADYDKIVTRARGGAEKGKGFFRRLFG